MSNLEMNDTNDTIDMHLVDALEEKYYTLLRYARQPKPDEENREWMDAESKHAEDSYPEDTAQLQNPDTSDWAHGFNSGMVAAMRIIQRMADSEEGRPMAHFPQLGAVIFDCMEIPDTYPPVVEMTEAEMEDLEIQDIEG